MTLTTNNGNTPDRTPRDLHWWLEQIALAGILGMGTFYLLSWIMGVIG